jgi:hypothetical protein
VAVAPGEGVVGFCCLVAPVPGDRFAAVPGTMELAAMEVAVPFRRRGLFQHLFQTGLRGIAERSIVYAVADPAFREQGESKRAFRSRVAGVLGSVGFFPYPSSYPGAHAHRESAFFVHKGEDVTEEQMDHFLEVLRGPEPSITIGISLQNAGLRNLIRADLEHHGLRVVTVDGGKNGTDVHADVFVTGPQGPEGNVVSIRLVDTDEARFRGSVVWLPSAHVDRLPEIVRREVARRRNTRWLRSSSNGS